MRSWSMADVQGSDHLSEASPVQVWSPPTLVPLSSAGASRGGTYAYDIEGYYYYPLSF